MSTVHGKGVQLSFVLWMEAVIVFGQTTESVPAWWFPCVSALMTKASFLSTVPPLVPVFTVSSDSHCWQFRNSGLQSTSGP